MEKRFTIGTTAKFPRSYSKKCIFCKHDTYFTDKWDWKVQKPACMSCALKNKIIDPDSIRITPETEENVKKRLNISGQDFEQLIVEIKKQLKEKVCA